MAIREFDAHKWSKEPTRVSFRTKGGEKVQFTAMKEQKVPVHVRFKIPNRSSR